MFECHITVSTDHAEAAEIIAKEVHWKTSEIARDPVLGDKNFFYLTTHTKDYGAMWTRLRNCVILLENAEIPVIREKIELIIHDTKVKVNEAQVWQLPETY
ncbi:MAG TPA: hypothetical protein VIY47_14230 [Ignavibacteriaceae bacterium]